MRSARPSRVMPALLTSTRIGPCSSSMRVNAASTLPVSRTSQSLLDRPTAFKPSPRRRSTIAAPIPRLPPVTTAQGRVESELRADMHALLPAHDAGAPDEAGAERDHQDVGP